jgi:hypothetical protein
MISTELSMIKMKDQERASIAASIAAFLSLGGEITAPESNAPTRRISEGRQTQDFQRPAVKAESSEQAVRIRTLAKTLNRDEICEKEGITLGKLRGIGRRYNIEFLAGPKKSYAPNKVTPESEALLVIRVKDCMAKNVNRSQCAKALGISTTLLLRLIEDYEIDYPKMKPAFR